MKGLIIGLVLAFALIVGGFFAFSGSNSGLDSASDSANVGSAGENSEVIEKQIDSDMGNVETSGGAVETSGGAIEDSANGDEDSSGATTHEVDIVSFKVPTLTIKVGDTVTWTNKDGSAHTATANDGSFDTDRLETGESGSFTFTKAGEFDYFCEIHPSMKGKVIVE